jgi:hypothetical protein
MWCPVGERLKIKIAWLVHQSLKGRAPEYLVDILVVYIPRRSLRSSEAKNTVLELGSARTNCGRGAFAIAGPCVWNGLPWEFCTLKGSSHSFKDRLVRFFLDSL